MKQLTLQQKIIIGVLALVVVCLGFFAIKEYKAGSLEAFADGGVLVISHDSGFYNEDVMFEVTGDNIQDILYTTDGSKPSKDNPVAQLYIDGIYMPCESAERVHTIRMLVYYEDGSVSDIINRSFILGMNVKERYDLPVLSVTAPEEFFFDEEHGRMTSQEGKMSRGREWEEEVFMTLFDQNGEVLLTQNCGFRLFGNFSREKNQRSFRLYGRSEYDELNDFEYALFDNQYAEDNTLVTEYKRIDVRNAGQDNGYAFIRGEFATRLCLEAGYPDAPCARPVAVYLNNTYYGCYWIITNFSEDYYRETYGEYEGTMYTFAGTIRELELDEDETDEVAISLIEEYNATMAEFENADLTQEENWQAVNDFMDVENFLQYVAIQHYIGNTDSFFNNYKIYRYVAPENGEYTEDSVFDGRYRFILFDLDWGFAFQGGDFKTHVEDLTTTDRMESPMLFYKFFQNLMQREDCREYYVRYMLSMQNYYFSYDYAKDILDEMHQSRIQELRYTYLNTNLLVNNALAPDVTSDAEILDEMDRIYDFLENRKYYTAEDLSGCFGPYTTYDLILQNEQEAHVTLDYATIHEAEFQGMYYKEIPVSMSVEAREGYCFDYWLINGVKYDTPTVEITDVLIQGSKLEIECICSPDPDAGLYITAVKTGNGEDYIELTNMGSEARNLKDYYLTDDDTWNKSPLPGIEVAPGESIIVYCENYTGVEALGQPYVKFNLKAGEVLSLYRSGQQLVQTLAIPELGVKDNVYSMDRRTGEFKEVKQ